MGLGKILGAVTRKRYTAPDFKLNFLYYFFCVGLCPTRFLPVQDAWRLNGRRIQGASRETETHGALDCHRTAGNICKRTPRSRSDRAAITARSSRDRGSFVVESPPRSLDGIHWRIEITINSRSWPDRGAIVDLLTQKLWLIPCQSESHDATKGDHSHDPSKPRPRPRQLSTIFGLIFPLKTDVFLSCSSTFDRFVK